VGLAVCLIEPATFTARHGSWAGGKKPEVGSRICRTASGCQVQVESSIPSLPPPHAGCPRGDPGPLRLLQALLIILARPQRGVAEGRNQRASHRQLARDVVVARPLKRNAGH
jgi:hypothetical protein